MTTRPFSATGGAMSALATPLPPRSRPLTPAFRAAIEMTIQRLIDVLDEIDGNPDLEAGGDDEPTLGWATQNTGVIRHGVEVLADGEAEGSLGWCGHGCGQNWPDHWYAGMGCDLEHDDLDRGEECW